jgi:hypothetical protein
MKHTVPQPTKTGALICERCGFESKSQISYELHLDGCTGWSTLGGELEVAEWIHGKITDRP